MDNKPALPFTLPLGAPRAALETAGGKGASLARLINAGLPVPPGFHITTAAYNHFVAQNDLQEKILAALAAVQIDHPATLEDAARQILDLFMAAPLPPEIATAVRQAALELGTDQPVAVRSSATAEDLPGLSFAGQQESYLNILGEQPLLEAVKRCWASLWTARAVDYRARHNIPPQEVSLAVVVQKMIPADVAGVLFTADPLTGARDHAMINAAWGLGETLVSGRVIPDTFILDKNNGQIISQQINDKALMAVGSENGTQEIAVPPEQRRRPTLTAEQAARLNQLGLRIEQLYGCPMDIEWTLLADQFSIVQARPITTLDQSLVPEVWNDTLDNDYLWTNGNFGEAIPDVMTPCTKSLCAIFTAGAMGTGTIPGYRIYGDIGGRPYMNMSTTTAIADAFGMKKKLAEANEQVFGKFPPGMEIPALPISRWKIIGALLPQIVRVLRRVSAHQKKLPEFLVQGVARCETMRRRIQEISTPAALFEFWQDELRPYFDLASQMLEASNRQDRNSLVTVRLELQKLVGDADANAMLTSPQTGSDSMASLGLLIGLTRLAQGEIDRATFAREYGHRSPHEFEISTPRPGEDPAWVDRQLAGLKESRESLQSLLTRQEKVRDAAWGRFRARYPGKEVAMRRKIERWTAISRSREAARSEVIRTFWVLRDFVLRAGLLTGKGEELFFLHIDEILALLHGDSAVLEKVPVRRLTYQCYAALPAYPAIIRGRFDPFKWAADPHRRNDYFDATHPEAPISDTISGFSGVPGIVEGRARVIFSPEEGETLQSGEILVTTITNVGWTPIFPRAAAIVTDVGAPLSHAVIVARELGIPAVVSCGNATMRIHTGDWIRVNGDQGTVEVLQNK